MSVKVLYIEDNPLNMRLVRKLVDSFGYQAICAANGTDGLALVESERPDIILTDINLPDIDGLQIAGQLKANEETRHIPVIAITANAMHGDRERCLEAGCDAYIAKPIARQELKNILAFYTPTCEEDTQPFDGRNLPQ